MARSASISAFFEPGSSDWLLFTFYFCCQSLDAISLPQSATSMPYDGRHVGDRRKLTVVSCVWFSRRTYSSGQSR